MNFRRTLVRFDLDTEWISPIISDMHACLQLDEMPISPDTCEECLYLETASNL